MTPLEEMRILAVDDVEDNLFLLESILEDAGFTEIETAASAAEAFEKLGLGDSKAAPRHDLVLMDIMMPVINGIEAVRRLKSEARFADIPVIMVTAKTEAQSLADAFAAGAMDYVTKPVDEIELIARVRSALRLKREMDLRKAREAELAQTLAQLEEDLEAAGRIQRQLLPAENVDLGKLAIAWRFLPCGAVGGDIFQAFRLGRNHIGFYLIDVSGHGVAAALLAVSAHKLLEDQTPGTSLIVDGNGIPLPPQEVVSRLNQRFVMDLEEGKYLTMAYGLLELEPELSLQLVQAGHPPLLLARAGKVEAACTNGDLPVGLFPDVEFHSHTLKLLPGDRLFLYSDGLIEARRGEEQYGQSRLAESIREGTVMPLEECTGHIIASLEQWLGKEKPDDDVSLLVLEFHAG